MRWLVLMSLPSFLKNTAEFAYGKHLSLVNTEHHPDSQKQHSDLFGPCKST